MGRSRNTLRINCRQPIKIIRYVNPVGKINYGSEGPDGSRYTSGYQHRTRVRRRTHSRQYLRPQGEAARRSLKVYRARSVESFSREVRHALRKNPRSQFTGSRDGNVSCASLLCQDANPDTEAIEDAKTAALATRSDGRNLDRQPLRAPQVHYPDLWETGGISRRCCVENKLSLIHMVFNSAQTAYFGSVENCC